MSDVSNYDQLRADGQQYYNRIGKIHSPVFNQDIYFNAEGFNHIVYKGSRSEREKPSQILRFKLLPLAVKLIKTSTTYQEYEETIQEFEVKKFKQKSRESKAVKYWGLIAIIDGRKIKVIIRRVGENGLPHFWSIVPAWVTNQYRDTKFYSTMKGNPAED